MKSTQIVPGGRTVMVIGCKYNYRKVLCFIADEEDGSTGPGDPYLSHFLDIYSNASVSHVVCPYFMVGYFSACNTIYNNIGYGSLI